MKSRQTAKRKDTRIYIYIYIKKGGEGRTAKREADKI